jgi:hypothetical protein
LRYDAGLPNSRESIAERIAAGRVSRTWPWAMALVRSVLFVALQSLVALLVGLVGSRDAWADSVRWWPLTATFANVANLALLSWLANGEGIRLRDLYHLDRGSWKRDTRLFVGAFVVLVPLTILPSSLLSLGLWGSVDTPTATMFQALPLWAAVPLLVLFPVSVALSELPTYFGYAMPRLQALTGRRTSMLLLLAGALALQHVVLPLVLDWRFVAWRLLMYAPFALFVAWALDRRPTLMPYFMGMHVLLDTSVPIYVLLALQSRF